MSDPTYIYLGAALIGAIAAGLVITRGTGAAILRLSLICMAAGGAAFLLVRVVLMLLHA
jgi:hypothetical protein